MSVRAHRGNRRRDVAEQMGEGKALAGSVGRHTFRSGGSSSLAKKVIDGIERLRQTWTAKEET